MKRLMFALGLLVGLAGTAAADSNTYNYLGSDPYFNARSGQRVTDSGLLMVNTDTKLTTIVPAALPTSLATATTGRSDLVDLSAYKHVALEIHWDVADSSAIGLGILVYNKASGAWADNDTPIFFQLQQTSATLADTSTALTSVMGNIPNRPTVYLFRSTTAPVGNTYTLTAISKTPRIVPGASGCTINFDGLCQSWNYVGVQIVNCNGSTVDQIGGNWLVKE